MSRNERSSADRPHGKLYAAMADDDASTAEKQERALEIGRDHLGVENGHVERVTAGGDVHEVVASVGAEEVISVGMTLDAAKTYCRLTLAGDAPLAVSDAAADGYEDDPARLTTGMECYLGAPIRVDGEPYGTVCFVDRDPRSDPFTADERAFVELIARLLGRELETRRHERELEERERRLVERERALERAETEYETLVETAPDAILLVDAETREVVRANEAAASLADRPRETLVGARQADLHPPDEADRYRAALDRAARADDPVDRFPDGSPLLVRRPDGTDVPVEVSANEVGSDGRSHVLAVVRDVSDRRERTRELRTKTRAIDEAAIGVTVADADAPDEPLVYVNRWFEQMTGYDAAEATGRNCRFLQGPETDEATVDRLRTAIDAREPVSAELLNYRADGTPFWNELSLAPVHGPDGNTTHYVGFQRDVTDRKRRGRLLDVLNRILRHNLRNGLQIIESYARMIAECETGETADFAGTVVETADDLATLGEKTRELEASAGQDAVPASVDGLLADAVDAVRESHDAADVRVDGLGSKAYVPACLGRAVEELVENAVVHGEGATVEVAARWCGDGPASGRVRLSVTDDGPGVPDHERRPLEQGYETNLNYGGGIGLWTVNWLVTDVGGSVDIATDDGTRVCLRVVATDDPDEEPSAWNSRKPTETGVDDAP